MTPPAPPPASPPPACHFPPTPEAALARLAAVDPAAYARSRNALDGAVTRLSPYLTHGFLGLPEVLAAVAARHRLPLQHKFVFELGWRAYFRHVWDHHGEAILQSLHAGPLPDHAYAPQLPADVRRGRTGVPAIDMAVRTLYDTGYLHNHARLWLASYVVHMRKVHWRAGADWLATHLLDGDLASNHLSWQWVAGTGSSKPYVFNAENVARFAPPAWHSPGSVLDQSYDVLDALARSPDAAAAGAASGRSRSQETHGVVEPTVSGTPPEAALPCADALRGRDVWLVHPWALGDPPPDLPPQCVRLGWWPAEHHAAHPWSAARWAFAGQRMAALCTLRWHGRRDDLAQALSGARQVQTWSDPHIRHLLPPAVVQRTATPLFAEVDRPCASFSGWWHRATRGMRGIEDLPGLRGLDRAAPA